MASSKGSSPVYTSDSGSDYAGNNPVNPFSTGDTPQLGQYVDTNANYGPLGGDVLPVRPPA